MAADSFATRMPENFSVIDEKLVKNLLGPETVPAGRNQKARKPQTSDLGQMSPPPRTDLVWTTRYSWCMHKSGRRRRYDVSWPLRYRRAEHGDWRAGRTVNMSVSGVLFEAQEALSPDDAVEISILFEAQGRQIPGSLITTSGHVVRTESKVPALIAVKFALAS